MCPRTAPMILLTLTCLLAGCGSSHERDAEGGSSDGGAIRDAATPVDSGSSSDASTTTCLPGASTCGTSAWCDFPAGSACGSDGSTGVCRPTPGDCPTVYSPVCGCDDRTYGNACVAHASDVAVRHEGECESAADACTNAAPCSAGVCTGDSCEAAWTCVDSSVGCTEDEAPYCGCDGNTFYDSSTCPRQPFAHRGACEASVRCDARDVACRALPPECPDGEVPSVEGACWGECVEIEQCACEAQEECPEGYACHSREHCGPYVSR